MLAPSLKALLLLPVALRLALAQASNATTACNNGVELCQRAYNNITHLGAHDSPFVRDASNGFDISGNQYYNSTVQLNAGVRLLSAQVQTNSTSNQLSVCHTSCSLLDAGTLSSWLREVNTWLLANENEVVTVLLVNGAGASATDLAAEYEATGVSDIAYRPASSTASQTWPTLQDLISNGTRLLSFVSTLSDNSAAPYLMNEFTYVFENSYENYTPSDFSCTAARPPTVANQTATALASGLMPLMNHFLYEQQGFGIETPNDTYAATTNAPTAGGGVGNLGDAATRCASEYGRNPTFLLVDFFNVGPAISTVDRLNGVTDPVGRTAISTAVASASTSGAASAVALRGSMLCLSLLAIAYGLA
ncbi:hypothetical protein LTR53_016287 [Teratosphaeriaceae sp. CCFEE 6253]|nr:hypothetical protein LTR53_016287 [Teratosphaeriaceae sp. CCFEE 6253]